MKYLIGNWKSNFTLAEAQTWIDQVKPQSPSLNEKLQTVICPSYHHLPLFKASYPELTLGIQTVSPYPDGTYTGAISARQLAGLVKFVILGHSERRTYFAETDAIVAKQTIQALENHLTPIIAVDKQNWINQLSQFNSDQISRCLVMYEPPEAISRPDGQIGSGQAASLDEVVDKIKQIKADYQALGFIYGGSVKGNNIAEFISHPEIDGALPGSASLNPEEWLNMIKAALEVLS